MTATPSTSTRHVPAIQTRLERIVEGFVQGVRGDPDLNAFAADRDVILHFRLTDLPIEFHFGFREGAVIGAIGRPSSAHVRLEMEADILDGMLTGRIDALKASLAGKLGFSGDPARAVILQHIQSALTRLYSESRAQVGDPGDLTGLAAAPATGAAPEAQVVVREDDPRHELVSIVNELYAASLITATGGNVSVRVPGTQDQLWITPSRLFKGDLRPEILVRVDLEGETLDPGARSPSSELEMHTAIYKGRPEANAVIHAHAPHATILVDSDLPFLPISTEAAFLTQIGRIPFIMPGTAELGDAVVEAMGRGWSVLMQNHGIVVAGRSLRRAADMAQIIDRTAQVIVGCYAMGKEPRTLPRETVEILSKMGDLMA